MKNVSCVAVARSSSLDRTSKGSQPLSLDIVACEGAPWPALEVSVRAFGAARVSKPSGVDRSLTVAARNDGDAVDGLLLRALAPHGRSGNGSYAIGPHDFAAVLALLRQHSPACRYHESPRVSRVEILAAPVETLLEIGPADADAEIAAEPRASVRAVFRCPETAEVLGQPLVRTAAYWTFGNHVAPPPLQPDDPLLASIIAGTENAARVYRGSEVLDLLCRARTAMRSGALTLRLDSRLLALNVSPQPLQLRAKAFFDTAGDLIVRHELFTPDGTVVPPEGLVPLAHDARAAAGDEWVTCDGRAYRLPPTATGSRLPEDRKLTGDAIADFLITELPALRAAGAHVAPDVAEACVYQALKPCVSIGASEAGRDGVVARWFFEPVPPQPGEGGRDSQSRGAPPALAPVEILGAAALGQRYLRQGNRFVRVDREAVATARRQIAKTGACAFDAGGIRGEQIPELLAWSRRAAADVQTPWNVYVTEAVAGAHIVKDDPATVRLQLDAEEEGGSAWFTLDAAFDHGGEVLSEDELRELVRQGKKWFRKGNTWVKVDAAALHKFDRGIRRSGAWPRRGSAGRTCYRFRPAARERVTEIFSLAGTIAHAKRYRKFLDQLRGFEGLEPASPPATLGLGLRSYQQQGYEWLAFLAHYGLNGILADDMGLGKTAQTIAILARMKEQSGPAPALVVTPTSLIDNWRAEVRKFCPSLRVMAYRGSPRRRDELRREMHACDLVLSTYGTVRNDASLLRGIEWRYVILDEAHFIKNSTAATTKAVKTIPAAHRLALTGTPVQNRLTELWSLFDFLMPGFLGRQASFRESCEEPIARLQSGRAETSDEKAAGEGAIEGLRERLRPFILRRLKTDVAGELPPKIENDIFCALTPEQAALYRTFAESAEARTALSELAAKGAERATTAILAALTSLRKICNHPDLMCLPRNAGRQRIAAPLPGYEKRSGKLEPLGELLQQCREGGHRALVFCQSTSMLDILGHYLTANAIAWLRLDGETPGAARLGLVERFNAECALDAFLISTRAGGTGLNLTGADTVIFYDHDWNPAADQQAQDRAYRIGQQRVVNVYRLICKGTLEEKILRRQELKKLLADTILQPGLGALHNLTREELLSLFTLSTDAAGA